MYLTFLYVKMIFDNLDSSKLREPFCGCLQLIDIEILEKATGNL